MYWPLLSITVCHLLLHKQINVLHSSTDIFSHSPFKLVHSSSTFLGFFSLALSFSNFQTFSIGSMSVFWAGHFITVTSSSERNVLIDFAVWHGALSCIDTASWLIAISKLGTCFFNISLYTVVLILPCSLTRFCTSNRNHAKHHHTSFSKFNAALSALHQTNLLPSQLNRLNFDSSLKWPQSHCSSVHMTFSSKFLSAQFVLFRYVRLRRSYLTVQIYFLKSSGNSVPWYFNAKVSINSFRDSRCCQKSILFWFITNPSVFLAVVFLGLTCGFSASHDLVSSKYYEWHF